MCKQSNDSRLAIGPAAAADLDSPARQKPLCTGEAYNLDQGLTWCPCCGCRCPPATAAAAAVMAAAHSGLDMALSCGDSAERCPLALGGCRPPSAGGVCPCAASKSAYALYAAPGAPQLMVGRSVLAHSCSCRCHCGVTTIGNST